MEEGVVRFLIVVVWFFAGFCFGAAEINIPASRYHKAETACVSLGSHVEEFDRTGTAICQNTASIDYIEFDKSKK